MGAKGIPPKGFLVEFLREGIFQEDKGMTLLGRLRSAKGIIPSQKELFLLK